MTTAPLDMDAIKRDQRTTWNDVSAGWEAVLDDFERGAHTVTTRLLELADLRAGQAVLDIATGGGEPALSAARLVGSAGRVVGVDIAPAMLEIARRRATGVDNVEFVEADLESLDQPAHHFDVVLSRFGLMFAIDHISTFGALARLLVPGGVLAAAVWGPQSTHLMSTGPTALNERLAPPPPPPGVPGPFSMSDSRQLSDELAAAGFAEVSVTEHVVPFRFDSIDDYVRFNRRALPPRMLAAADDKLGSGDEVDRIVAGSVAQFADGDGTLRLPSTALLLRAVASTVKR
jgi:SAM-dependent methyltransferase